MTLPNPIRRGIKRIAFSALANPFLLRRRIERSAREQRLTVLSFHRVGPPDGSAYVPLRPDLFEEAVSFCKRHFELIQFRQLEEHSKPTKPLAIITFDDGYRDFLDYSLPILRGCRVTCNHNLVAGCLLSGLPPINVLIQDVIGKAAERELELIDRFGWTERPCARDREVAGLQVSRTIKSKPMAEQQAIVAGLERNVDLKSYATAMMTLEDARSIRDEVELGAHSFDHASMSVETDEYIESDARKCLAFFQAELGAPTDIFALPNGDGASRASPIVREAGFRHILLTEETYSDSRRLDHPRFTMAGSSRAEVRYRSAGFVRH